MPAPTALLKPAAPPEPAAPPAAENEDEVLLDVQESNLAEASAAVPPPPNAEDAEMAVDEEGRPRFAPGKDVVRGLVDYLD